MELRRIHQKCRQQTDEQLVVLLPSTRATRRILQLRWHFWVSVYVCCCCCCWLLVPSWAQQQQQSNVSSSSSSTTTTTTTTQNNKNSNHLPTIADLISNRSDVSLLELACRKAYLWQLLNDTSTIVTFLGPTDDIFQQFISLPPYSNYLTDSWILHLQQLLMFHIIPNQALNSSQLLFMSSSSSSSSTTATTLFWPTALGVDLVVNTTSQTIGDDNDYEAASLIITNLVASNGYWHVPDQVLVPDRLQVTVQQLLLLDNSTTTTTTTTNSVLSNFSFDTMKRLLQVSQLDYLLGASSGDSRGLTVLAVPDSSWSPSFLVNQVLFPTTEVVSSASTNNNIKSILLYHIAPVNIYPNFVIKMDGNSLSTTTSNPVHITMLNNVSAWFTAAASPTISPSQINHKNVTATTTGTSVLVNGATVLVNNALASNGVLQVIDQVLMPPNLLEQLEITTQVTNSAYSFLHFLSLLGASRINLTISSDAVDDDTTLFAPLDVAFENNGNHPNTTTDTNTNDVNIAKLLSRPMLWSRHLQSLILHHMTQPAHPISYFATEPTKLYMQSGYTITLVPTATVNNNNDNNENAILIGGTTRVVLKDLFATNGVIHGIDRILVPPSVSQSIYQQLVANPTRFSTFILLLQATNMTSLLQDDDEGPFTVLAPVNEAFPGLVYTAAQLPSLLLGHVIPTNLFTDQLTTMIKNGTTTTTTLQALNGIPWPVQVYENGTISIGNAQITLANVLASNGVIQVVDKVLQLPNGTTIAPSTIQPTGVPSTTPSPPPPPPSKIPSTSSSSLPSSFAVGPPTRHPTTGVNQTTSTVPTTRPPITPKPPPTIMAPPSRPSIPPTSLGPTTIPLTITAPPSAPGNNSSTSQPSVNPRSSSSATSQSIKLGKFRLLHDWTLWLRNSFVLVAIVIPLLWCL